MRLTDVKQAVVRSSKPVRFASSVVGAVAIASPKGQKSRRLSGDYVSGEDPGDPRIHSIANLHCQRDT